MPNDDSHGVAGITLPMGTVVRVVVFSLGIGATVWGTTSGLRSDVRDILTQMKAVDDKRVLQDRLVDERMETMRETVNDLKRRLELTQFEVGTLKEMILKLPQDH
jgi:hypothetical protein